MPSVKINLPTDTWVNVSGSAASGTITHNSGTADILFVQAVSSPSLTPPRDNAIASIMRPLNDRDLKKIQYFSGLASEKIWACSVDGYSIVVSTDSEV